MAEQGPVRAGQRPGHAIRQRRFDAAMILHVGMNLPRQAEADERAARVLKPGGIFAVYDVMRLKAGVLAFPLPWASSEAISFVATPMTIVLCRCFGFSVIAEPPTRTFAIEFFATVRARMAAAQADGKSLHPASAFIMARTPAQRSPISPPRLKAAILAPVELLLRLG